MYTAWTLLGLDAAHVNPADVRNHGRNGYEYLGDTLAQDTDPGSIERTILAVATAGVDPLHFSHVNLVARLERFIRPDGSIENLTNLTTFGVLALERGDVTPSARMISWLVHQQDRDGGFNFATGGGTSDVDDTGAVLSVLGKTAVRRRYPGSSVAPCSSSAASRTATAVSAISKVPRQTPSRRHSPSAVWTAQG